MSILPARVGAAAAAAPPSPPPLIALSLRILRGNIVSIWPPTPKHTTAQAALGVQPPMLLPPGRGSKPIPGCCCCCCCCWWCCCIITCGCFGCCGALWFKARGRLPKPVGGPAFALVRGPWRLTSEGADVERPPKPGRARAEAGLSSCLLPLWRIIGTRCDDVDAVIPPWPGAGAGAGPEPEPGMALSPARARSLWSLLVVLVVVLLVVLFRLFGFRRDGGWWCCR
mmetsp:Transcript_2266/g.4163  ORF Transcript_2266/g.4163 Transcript_2266/m.4163 type:complete len:226 (+) Transcript_2266:1412-2089(+)